MTDAVRKRKSVLIEREKVYVVVLTLSVLSVCIFGIFCAVKVAAGRVHVVPRFRCACDGNERRRSMRQPWGFFVGVLVVVGCFGSAGDRHLSFLPYGDGHPVG